MIQSETLIVQNISVSFPALWCVQMIRLRGVSGKSQQNHSKPIMKRQPLRAATL